MDVNECGKLIERYWEGDTSCDEEQAMVHFFGEHSELPPELERWRGWFSGLHAAPRCRTNHSIAGFWRPLMQGKTNSLPNNNLF